MYFTCLIVVEFICLIVVDFKTMQVQREIFHCYFQYLSGFFFLLRLNEIICIVQCIVNVSVYLVYLVILNTHSYGQDLLNERCL